MAFRWWYRALFISSFLVVGRQMSLFVKPLTSHAIMPCVSSSAGCDLFGAYNCVLPSFGKALVKTDVAIVTYARVAPRSGVAWRHSIQVGSRVVDRDYFGQVAVLLFNHSAKDFEIRRGDLVALLILERIVLPEVVSVLLLPGSPYSSAQDAPESPPAGSSLAPAPSSGLLGHQVDLVSLDSALPEPLSNQSAAAPSSSAPSR